MQHQQADKASGTPKEDFHPSANRGSMDQGGVGAARSSPGPARSGEKRCRGGRGRRWRRSLERISTTRIQTPIDCGFWQRIAHTRRAIDRIPLPLPPPVISALSQLSTPALPPQGCRVRVAFDSGLGQSPRPANQRPASKSEMRLCPPLLSISPHNLLLPLESVY